MKLTMIALSLFFVGNLAAHATISCDDPLRQSEVCYKMQHIRAEVNALDAQREMMQVNFPYLEAIGINLKTTANEILEKYGSDDQEHLLGLKAVASLAGDLATNAKRNNSNALVYANLMRSRCVTCHSSQSSSSGINWKEIFKYDWDMIAKRCNEPGRNPYLCRSMNGILSAYSYFLTAYNANIKSFDMSKQAADEIVRILQDLKKNKIMHVPEELRFQAETSAKEISELAAARDESVFEKALQIPAACMKCHEEKGNYGYGGIVTNAVNMKWWGENYLKAAR